MADTLQHLLMESFLRNRIIRSSLITDHTTVPFLRSGKYEDHILNMNTFFPTRYFSVAANIDATVDHFIRMRLELYKSRVLAVVEPRIRDLYAHLS